MRRADASERFPVVYATDSDDLFGGLATMANALQVHGETPRFILVGIGYGDTRASQVLRMRDYLTHSTRAHFQQELEQLTDSPLVAGGSDLMAACRATD